MRIDIIFANPKTLERQNVIGFTFPKIAASLKDRDDYIELFAKNAFREILDVINNRYDLFGKAVGFDLMDESSRLSNKELSITRHVIVKEEWNTIYKSEVKFCSILMNKLNDLYIENWKRGVYEK